MAVSRQLFAVLMFSAAACCAQDRPRALLRTEEAGRLSSGSIVDLEEMSFDENAFYWKDTLSSASGYLDVLVAPEYLDLVQDLFKQPTTPMGAARVVQGIDVTRLRPSSQFREDSFRTNLFFETSHGLGMLTLWNFDSAGAKVFRHKQFLNTRVAGVSATVALARSASDGKALWKLTWAAEGVQFELYIPDNVIAGAPSLTTNDIGAIAEAVHRSR